MNHKFSARVFTRTDKFSVHTTNHFIRKGLLAPIGNPDNRYRCFRSQDNEQIRFNRLVQRLELGLKEICEIVMDAEAGGSFCPWVRDILRQRIQQNRRKLDAMMAFQRKMEQAHA